MLVPTSRTNVTTQSPWNLVQIFHEQRLSYIPVMLLAAGCLYAMFRSIHWPLLHDALLMHYISSRILSGAVPYRDLFDMNMPGTYVIHMAVLSAFGKSDIAWRMFDLLWLTFSAWTIGHFCHSYGRIQAYFAALFYMAVHLSAGPSQMGQRDFLMCPFLMLSAHYMALSLETTEHRHFLFWAGFFLGLAMTIKPSASFLLGMFCILYIYLSQHENSMAPIKLIRLFAGACIGPILALTWVLITGGIYAFWEMVTHWLPLYGGLERATATALLLTVWSGLKLALPACLLSLPLFWFAKPIFNHPRLLILLLGSSYAALQYIIQGKGWPYHLEPFYFFFFTMITILFSSFTLKRYRFIRHGITTVLCFLALPMTINAIVNSRGHDDILLTKKPSVTQLVADLSAIELNEAETVQVLDSTTGGIHALYRLGLRQPTRFIYDIQFFTGTDQPYIQNLRREFIEALKALQPAAIVVFHDTWIPPYDISRFDTFPQFSDFLKNRYQLERKREAYSLYIEKA
ncbi:MAG: glycosyltransferase family 39 protein [Nitrospirales bacterium]|nr:glycosyltransferase family 39 protein [Nitrospira sp.]MDR4501763.1 glycosyltransferase family 39 protein [Nitrospirales bacterium]